MMLRNRLQRTSSRAAVAGLLAALSLAVAHPASSSPHEGKPGEHASGNPVKLEQAPNVQPRPRLRGSARPGATPPAAGLRSSFAIRINPAWTLRDQYVALESVQFALSRVGDGSSYVWHRGHGRLSGIVRPLSTFRSTDDGRICRRLTIVLASTRTKRETTTFACRMENGVWQLEG